MVLWMCDQAARHASAEQREAWYAAALRSHDSIMSLMQAWRVRHSPWYQENSREFRDDVLPPLERHGAVVRDYSVGTHSPRPRWSLATDFSQLFDPALTSEALDRAIADWQEQHIGAPALARLETLRRALESRHEVTVRLPDSTSRTLAAGPNGEILKGIIERLTRDGNWSVLLISEGREPVHTADAAMLRRIGIRLPSGALLPDALLFDADAGALWFIESVPTEGPVDEPRKRQFLQWAVEQGFRPENCRYLSAFLSRRQETLRRYVDSLAWGTLAWFLDEPEQVFDLRQLDS